MNDEKENARLDELNNGRVETTKRRVAHAIRLVSNPADLLFREKETDTAKTDLAHAVNLLEAAVEEMRWACRHFDWDDGVCDQIDDACSKLGQALAELMDGEDPDVGMAGCMAQAAMASLGKTLATLQRWFDEDQDVSEV